MALPELHKAVAGQKSKPSDYNDNFDIMLAYISEVLSIYQDINELDTSGIIELEDETINKITPTGNVTFTLPTVTDTTKHHQILVHLNLSTLYDISLGTTASFNETLPTITAIGKYEIVWEYVIDKWVVGVMTIDEV